MDPQQKLSKQNLVIVNMKLDDETYLNENPADGGPVVSLGDASSCEIKWTENNYS